jgi:arylsulfatase A-like enzyme/Flp pilus assembly protein TadD
MRHRVSLSGVQGAKKLIVSCAIWATGLSAQSPQRPASQPNVFLVTIDTLRADHIHCYGDASIQTPGLDNLAKDGVRFAQAFTPSPITNTSHISILTGLLPSTHGVMDFAVPLPSEYPLWAELLKKRGYHTGAFIGSIVLDSRNFAPGLNRGFDFYDDFPAVAPNKSRWERLERRAEDVARRAETWLTANSGGPKFVWVHFYDPHDPYDPPPPFAQMYKNRLYDGEIAYADSVLAGFVTYLKKKGWYDDSIVIVVGDHGEGLGEHHEETHGAFLYDSTLHVPLIVKLQNQKHAGRVVEAQVRTTDILPTVVDLLRIPPAGRFDGESLLSFLGVAAATETAGRTAFGETDYPLRFGWAPLRSVRDEGFKFIEAPKPELYNLRSDPFELTNNYAPWDASVQKFRAMLSDSKRKIRVRAPSAGSVSKNTIAELEALGYLGRADLASSTNVPEPSLLPDAKDKIEQLNLLHQAMIASEDGRDIDARAALERALELDPISPTALRQLADFELQAGEFAKAAEHLKRALALHFDDSVTAFHLGQALVGEGDLAGAREALETSLKFNPMQFDARLLLGQVCLDEKKAKAAEDQFEAALLIEPQNSAAQLWLAKAQMAGKNFTEATRRLEPLAKSQPQNADIIELLAQAYAGLGREDEAERANSRAKALRNNHKP